MLRNLIFAVVLVVLNGHALAFDYSVYPVKDIDDVIAQGRLIDTERKTGVKVMTPPQKLSFDGRLEALPSQCKTDFLLRVMRIQGFKPEQLPPINTCFRTRTAKGEILTLYVQDAVSEFIEKELKLGDPVRLYVMYIYFSQEAQLPFFLANEFQTGAHKAAQGRLP